MDIVISRLPQTVEEFRALPDFHLDSPFQTAALYVVAICAWPLGRDVCYAMLDALKGPQPLSNIDKSFIVDRMLDGKGEYIGKAYFKGATPQNNYTPSMPLTVTVTENPYSYTEPGYARLFIHTAGSDNPRVITMRSKGNEWFIWNWGSPLAGIRQPVSADPWA